MEISISEIKDHNLCPMYHWNRWKEERRAVEEQSEAVTLGTYAHTHLADMMKGRTLRLGAEKLTAAERAVDTALVAWSTQYFHVDSALLPWDEVLLVEEPLHLQLTDDITLVGIPDAIVKSQGTLWHVQHKTIAQTIPVGVFTQGVAVSLHECGYAALIKNHYPNVPYGGTMLNIVRRMSEKRISDNPLQSLHLEFIPMSDARIADGIADITLKARQILSEYQGERVEKRRESCTGLYRNKLCGYYDSCWRGVSIHNDILYEDANPRTRYGVTDE